MNSDEKPTIAEMFPLPSFFKLRSHRFGAKPASPLTSVRRGQHAADAESSTEEFKIRWEIPDQGLTVLVQEQTNGRLLADVSCTDAGLLNKGFVSVALVGTVNDRMIRKTIPLNVPQKNGCSGSADFGLLEEAVTELGAQLRIIAILAVA